MTAARGVKKSNIYINQATDTLWEPLGNQSLFNVKNITSFNYVQNLPSQEEVVSVRKINDYCNGLKAVEFSRWSYQFDKNH